MPTEPSTYAKSLKLRLQEVEHMVEVMALKEGDGKGGHLRGRGSAAYKIMGSDRFFDGLLAGLLLACL